MKKILLIGAGQSASTLIEHTLGILEQEDWHLTIAEKNTELAKKKSKHHPRTRVETLDIENIPLLQYLVKEHDLVISMLPASLHFNVAKQCATNGRNFLTASYLSEEIKALNPVFKKQGKLAVMEMGLDPGIDHMSAMQVLDRLKNQGHQLLSFETFTGGLIDEREESSNPWRYKFTWNPRNVVLSGSGHVQFIQEKRIKYIPYHKLFRRTEVIYIPGYGYFEGYANRDSLKYLKLYDLKKIRTLYRGTLRKPGFCKAWDVFVQLGITDDSYVVKNLSKMSHRDFINSFLAYNPHDSVELKVAHYLNLEIESEIMYKLKWLGIFSNEKIGLKEATPAQTLEHILRKKWTLTDGEKDMIVMLHRFIFKDINTNAKREIHAHMVAYGESLEHTAMSKTVGLPLAVSAKLILKDKLKLKGVFVPTIKEIYDPIIKELQLLGFDFSEREIIKESESEREHAIY